MFYEQSLALQTAKFDAGDIIAVIMNYAVVSTLAGVAALAFAIATAALLDDRPLREFFGFSNLANRLRTR